ncbi:MAG: hypothetical protein LBF16_04880, partial [Pseudomonadales bacterium]|nr:hypothetical protein [Pseudomonadales bacterium]
EPIDPPVVVQRHRVTEGESLERMVIRSNYDMPTNDYIQSAGLQTAIGLDASQDFRASPGHDDGGYRMENERHFVPPKSSQRQCETHGLFDAYFGTGDWKQIKEGYAVAARESGTLYDAPVTVITPTVLKDIATTQNAVPQLPTLENPVGDRMAGGQYVIHAAAQIVTPWLPDGAASGIVLRAAEGHRLPGVTQAEVLGRPGSSCRIEQAPGQEFIIVVSHGGRWPDSAGFRLLLAERKAQNASLPYEENLDDADEPVWNEEERTLTLFVPKGRIVRLRYASAADKRMVTSFGIPQWTPDGQQGRSVHNAAMLGNHWMLTPFRDLTLVHATQAPVWEPRFQEEQGGNFFQSLILNRTLGSHDVKLGTRSGITLHGPSTGKFEIEASWHEWVDDITKDEPQWLRFQGQLGEIQLTEDFLQQHEKNYEEKFGADPSGRGVFQPFQLHEPITWVLNHATEGLPNASIGASPDAARGDIHALGDTRFRLIQYRLRASTRFREYLPPSIYGDETENANHETKVTRRGPVARGESMLLPLRDADDKEFDPGAPVLPALQNPAAGSVQQSLVPASAPPKDPRVLYVVPTFRWQQPAPRVLGRDVTRLGNGLRVWLDRPWFSSGDGELLGVVLHRDDAASKDTPTAIKDIPADFQGLVTQWGMDPFWDSPKPKVRSIATDFPARVFSEELNLQEKPGTDDVPVQIIGHRVHWDKARRLWYCDIELNPGQTYMPFVRLALVRYQPNALYGAKVSKVVLTDFAQVLPRRRAVVSVAQDYKVSAALYGPNPSFGPMKSTSDLWPWEGGATYGSASDLAYFHGEAGAIAAQATSPVTGRNRVELVLQTRHRDIASDLEWEDVAILADHVVGEAP